MNQSGNRAPRQPTLHESMAIIMVLAQLPEGTQVEVRIWKEHTEHAGSITVSHWEPDGTERTETHWIPDVLDWIHRGLPKR